MSAVDSDDKRRMLENARVELENVRRTGDPEEMRTFVDAVKAGISDGWLEDPKEFGSSEAEIKYFDAVASLG